MKREREREREKEKRRKMYKNRPRYYYIYVGSRDCSAIALTMAKQTNVEMPHTGSRRLVFLQSEIVFTYGGMRDRVKKKKEMGMDM